MKKQDDLRRYALQRALDLAEELTRLMILLRDYEDDLEEKLEEEDDVLIRRDS